MRILNVSYPFAPAGPDAVGGAEQILARLDAALTLAGHESFVLACAGSSVSGEHIPFSLVPGEITAEYKAAFYPAHRERIEHAIQEYRIELVHFHGIDFHEYLPFTGIPLLATLHLPLDWYPPEIFRSAHQNLFLHGVSHRQNASCPPSSRMLSVIENGVPVPKTSKHCRRNFSLCLGRICPEKGFHFAMDAAKIAGMPLLVCGEVFPYEAHQKYWREEIRTREDRFRRFIGPLGLKRKTRFLSAAKCLVAPSLVAETSSLATMEALACGTPVIAFRQGALPDLIEHGRTGFIVDSVEEMAGAMRRVHLLSHEMCRRAARARFSVEAMTARYLARYEELIHRPAPIERQFARAEYAR
jgi:glycosyltransferase involved in cell wall biosynthesis